VSKKAGRSGEGERGEEFGVSGHLDLRLSAFLGKNVDGPSALKSESGAFGSGGSIGSIGLRMREFRHLVWIFEKGKGMLGRIEKSGSLNRKGGKREKHSLANVKKIVGSRKKKRTVLPQTGRKF